MLEALLLLLTLQQSPSIGEYESNGCPGEYGVGFVATRPGLTIHTQPDRASARRRIPFRTGWRVVFAECRTRTLRGIDIATTVAAELMCGDNWVRIDAGTPLR